MIRCGPSEVAEIFPGAFRQLQCYVLVEDVLDVLEKLMMRMLVFRFVCVYVCMCVCVFECMCVCVCVCV